jgi:hypothetical protein
MQNFNVKKIYSLLSIALFCFCAFTQTACKKKEVVLTDADKPITRVNLIMPSQENFDLDKMLVVNDSTGDLTYVPDYAFGAISEFQLGKGITEPKRIYTNTSLATNITNLQQLKAMVNNVGA